MTDNRRDQLLELVEKEFIGPSPIQEDGYVQDNGEEILRIDPPHSRYIAGILFPKEVTEDASSIIKEGEMAEIPVLENEDDETDLPHDSGDSSEYLEEAEELINRSNAYRQSAISLTVAIRDNDDIGVEVSAGKYSELSFTEPTRGTREVHYLRKSVSWNNDGKKLSLPSIKERIKNVTVEGEQLQLDITYRYRRKECSIYTFTLENLNVGLYEDDRCYFQCKFKLLSENGFYPLPDSERININDEDYLSNQLLYRDVHNYAIGHGCAADWDDSDTVKWISTATFPTYEVKPIVPARIPGVTLEMIKYGPKGDINENISELTLLCDKYEEWIEARRKEKEGLFVNYPNKKYGETAERHISNCLECLNRMRQGIQLLKTNNNVRIAFQYMNLATLNGLLFIN